jgi:uncharacterized protein YecE (DUF72 family)
MRWEEDYEGEEEEDEDEDEDEAVAKIPFASRCRRYRPPTLDPLDKIKIGTCAWSFEDWRGVFYPEHLQPGERLAFYARHFHSVEVDSTFYATPAPKVALHWYEVTPPDFVFSCKLPREITHERRLREAGDALAAFLAGIHPLGEKLGCVLVQLPPSFRPRQDEQALRTFIRALPGGVRFAIEFRHHDWHQPRIVHLLEEHRVCWAWTDVTPLAQQQQGAFEFLPETTDFVYLRLLGDLERKYDGAGNPQHTYRELLWPRDASLENWAARLRQRLPDVSRALICLNNHFEGFAPQTAHRLAALLDLPLRPLPRPGDSDAESGQISLL